MAYNDSWAVGTAANRLVGTEDARRGVGALAVPGTQPYNVQSGLRAAPGNPGFVAATGTPGPTVTVNALQAFLDLAARPGAYIATMDATLTVDVLGANPADPSNQRNDLIVAQQNDADYGDADRTFTVKRITGTPAGSPVDPSVTGSPNYVTLARIRVVALATTIDNAHIDDLRPPWIVALGGLKPVRTQTERTALTPYAGMAIYRLDRNWTEEYDGSVWRVQSIAVCSSTADRDSAITNPYTGLFAFTTDTGTLWRYYGSWGVYPNKPSFDMRNTIAQSIGTAAFVPLTFDTEDNDSDNGHSMVTNTDRYVIPLPGLWEFDGGGSSAGNATGDRICRLTKNGTALAGSGECRPAASAANFSIVGARSKRVQCVVNDIIRVEYWQNSGGALNTGITDYAQPSFSGHWIKP